MNLQPIILAGGSGNRLWPLSNIDKPKQFIQNWQDLSLFQHTLLRNKSFGKALIITYSKYLDIIQKQLQEINIEASIMLEPKQIGTAYPVILGSHFCKQVDKQNILLLPADHYIADRIKYIETIKSAKSNFNLIGIKPDYGYSGYGYIKTELMQQNLMRKVLCFKEKPPINKATIWSKQANYFWNSGIYIFNTDYFQSLAKTIHPNLYKIGQEAFLNAKVANGVIEIADKFYINCKKLDFDSTLVENIKNMYMVEAKFYWQDMGSWLSMWQAGVKNTDNNCIIGNVETKNVHNSYIHADKEQKIAVIGVNDIVVVAQNNQLLIANKNETENVKGLQISNSYNMHPICFGSKTINIVPTVIFNENKYKLENIVVPKNGILNEYTKVDFYFFILKGQGIIYRKHKNIKNTRNKFTSGYKLKIRAGMNIKILNYTQTEIHILKINLNNSKI